jgi:glutamate 5-kinase
MNRTEFSNLIQKSKRIVIKIGSARVSGKEQIINDFLFGLVSDIRLLRDEGKEIVLVSSGAIAQGKKILSQNINNKNYTLSEKQAFAAIGQSRLMKLYENFFSKVNINIAQILFGAPQIQDSISLENLQNTFNQLLDWKVLPIVNENDSIATEELRLGDNDILSAMVSIVIHADLLIILTGVDGFYKEGNLIHFLPSVEASDLEHAKGPEGPGSGGMNTKLRAGMILSDLGIPTAIISGLQKHSIYTLVKENNIGTLIGTNVTKQKLTKNEIPKILKNKFNYG